MYHIMKRILLRQKELNGDTYDYQDRTLLFHPDLIRGTPLGKHMDDYTFFSYESREALHLSEKKQRIFIQIRRKPWGCRP
jgi:hypothetical protein